MKGDELAGVSGGQQHSVGSRFQVIKQDDHASGARRAENGRQERSAVSILADILRKIEHLELQCKNMECWCKSYKKCTTGLPHDFQLTVQPP